MRNTILALGSVASLTFATPAFAVGLCSDNPCVGDLPISGAFDTSPSQGLVSRTMYGASEQVPAHSRHTRNYHSGGYHHHG